jgi:hypothetical protein
MFREMFREFLRRRLGCVSSGKGSGELVALGLEINGGQRRNLQLDGPRAAVPGNRLRAHSAGVPSVAAFVIRGIAIEDFPLVSRCRNSDAVIQAQYWREIADHYDEVFLVARAPDERKNARGRIVRINPFEARPFEVHFEEGPFG